MFLPSVYEVEFLPVFNDVQVPHLCFFDNFVSEGDLVFCSLLYWVAQFVSACSFLRFLRAARDFGLEVAAERAAEFLNIVVASEMWSVKLHFNNINQCWGLQSYQDL